MSFVTFDSKTQNPEVSTVSDVTPEEVQSKLSAGESQIKIVDVRQNEEFVGELGHIPQAELIVLDQLESRVNELPKDQSIVFICRSGKRSITASSIALQNGYTDVYNMTGGMIRWNELGYDTEK